MKASTDLVSVVIPTRNRKEKLRRCIDSVFKSTYPNIELIVVDDCGDYDVAAEICVEFPSVTVLRNERRMLLSYSRNLGASYARGDYIFFLDDDNVIDGKTISELVKGIKANSVAVAAPVIYYYERPMDVWTYHIQKGRFPGFYVLHKQPPVNGLETFAFHDAFLVKKDIFDALGGFDHYAFPIHFSELDFAYRMQRKKYRATVVPQAKVWHDLGHEREHVDRIRAHYTLRNRVILMRRYAARRERVAYIFAILPVLTVYYLHRFVVHSSEGAIVTAFELFKGVIQGLAYSRRFWKAPSARARFAAKSRTLVTLPKVSIIVPTKNSGATLKQCLDSIGAQIYRNIEVIVVDNFSTDGTREIAKQYRFVKLFTAGPERSAQVNLGVKMSSGDYVYRVDSDFVLEPRVVEEAVRACELDNYDMIAVHNTSHPGISFWSRVRKLERDCYRDDTMNIAARFFKRSTFERVGGFDEDLIASEDYDLHRRLVKEGFGFGRIDAQEVHIGEPRSLKEVVLTHVYYGKKISEFLSKYPREPFGQLSPVRMSYLRHWRDFLNDPRLLVGFIVYQTVRYTSALFGYILSRTQK